MSNRTIRIASCLLPLVGMAMNVPGVLEGNVFSSFAMAFCAGCEGFCIGLVYATWMFGR